MKLLKLFLFLPFLIVGIAFADAPQSVGPISFGGGLNTASLATLIPDDDSPDMCNCLPEVTGTMSKRNGTDRFISQAISSNSVTSIYRTYASSVSWLSSKALIGSSYDKIFIATSDVNASWVILSSGNQDQNYNYVTMNGKVLITGDKLTENVRQYDILNSSQFILRDAFVVGASSGLNPRGKYQLVANNYYIIANVQISTDYRHLADITTYYSNRILYSGLNNTSSMTIQRFIDYNTNDGEEITGMGTLYGGSLYPGADFKNAVNVFKPSGIGELVFTVLDLPSLGGDWTFTEVARGLGCIAPRTLDSNGQAYIFLDKSGLVMWNRDQAVVISKDIKPLIDDLIRSGRYKSAVGKYYPKKQQYWLSFEHPNRFPKGKNNYVLAYDFRTGKWYPLCNINAQSFTVADNQDDTGQIYYGDSSDGYVHLADVETRQDDSRKEIVLDTMDSSFTWAGSNQDIWNVKEGTASVKVFNDGVGGSSITKMGVFNLGEWYDKTRVTTDDKLSFKAFSHDLSSITNFRIDFEVKNVTGSFDTNFTSVTLSSNSFSGNRLWTTFEIPLSSFQIQSDWTNLDIETVPFYNRFNIYGIRFVLDGVYQSSVSIDDLRIVGARDNPNRMYRFTKLFDFQSPSYKGFGQLLLTMDKSPDATFSIDIYNDFGQKIRTEKVPQEVPKEVLLFHKDGVPGFAILDSGDFSEKRSTKTVDTHWDCLNGVMDSQRIVCGDRGDKTRLISFNRNDFSTFSLVYGEFGSGTSNFNLIHEITQFPGGYLVSDLMNQRTKVHSYSNLGFLRQYGQLGSGGTNYHQPTGVAANNSNFFVSDESNNRLLKLDQSTFSIVGQTPVDHNIIAESSLAAGNKHLFMAYNNLSPISNEILEVYLEKRDIGNLDLLQRITVKPEHATVSTASYRMQGSIGLLGKYVFIGFNNECSDDGTITYYLQKRLQSNFELVKEYSSTKQFFSVAGYGLSYIPITQTKKVELKVEGRYIQLKFYDDDLDNYWKLYQMSPFVNVQQLTY